MSGDRHISAKSGQIVSAQDAAQNPETTYLRRDFAAGTPDRRLPEPIARVISALEWLERAEDHDAAEYLSDAVGGCVDYYRQCMQAKRDRQ
jgi:hypothetical protein